MRATIPLFLASSLAVCAFAPTDLTAQKEKLPPTQNNLVGEFADNPEKFNGKTLTFLGTYRNRTSADRLRDRVGEDGIPIEVRSPNGKAKLLMGLAIPKGFKAKDIPNVDDGESVIVTFEVTRGKTDQGNKAVSFRRPD